ncbi:MAG: NAD-dependent epimerase/dehydratase family protein [Candidatus Hodarchaeota archaeon]
MKVAITGISSFLASEILPLLDNDDSISEILGLDIAERDYNSSKVIFKKRDVRDPQLEKDLKGYDAILHLAFIVNPLKNKKEMYSINIDGSKNVFNCAIKAGVKKIVHASSVSAYGAFQDNPIPLTEEHPIRKMKKSFYYHDSKYAVEKIIEELEQKHPNVIFTRIRPHVFLGKKIDNFIKTFFKSDPMLGLSSDNLWQFVYVTDVAQMFYLALIKDAPGAYNCGADNPLTIREMGRKLNKKVKNIPYKPAMFLLTLLQKLRIMKKDLAGWIRISRYPIIVDSTKAKNVLGWEPEFDTMGTVEQFLEDLKELGLI